MKKKFIASLLVVCLLLSLSGPAFAITLNEIEGNSTMQDAVITVTVPTNLDFALDPAQTTLGPSQISNVSYSFENTAAFATLVAFYLDVNIAEDADGPVATLKPDDEMTDYAKMTATAKELSFGAIAAKTDDGTTVTYASATNASATTAVVAAEADGLEFGLMLAGTQVALDGTTGTNTANLNASFQFFSRMNAFADWQPGDVSVSGVYMLAAVPPATLTIDPGDMIVADTTGLVDKTSDAGFPARPTAVTTSTPGFYGDSLGSSATESVNISHTKSSGTDIVVKFYAGEDVSITSVRSATAWSPSDYTYNQSAKTITLKASKFSGASTMGLVVVKIVAGGVTYNVNLILS